MVQTDLQKSHSEAYTPHVHSRPELSAAMEMFAPFGTVTISHMWLLSTWRVAGAAEGQRL